MDTIICSFVLDVDVIVFETFSGSRTFYITKIFFKVCYWILLILNCSVSCNINPFAQKICINMFHILKILFMYSALAGACKKILSQNERER